MSLDGIVGSPQWASPFIDDDFERDSLERLNRADALLMGRGTYELFSKIWPGRNGDYPARVNGMKKYVFSSTLQEVDWANTEILRGEVLEQLRKLKAMEGNDLMIYGHGLLARTAFAAGLTDEVRLSVFPILVGTGDAISSAEVSGSLSLVESKRFNTGVVAMTYRPGTQ